MKVFLKVELFLSSVKPSTYSLPFSSALKALAEVISKFSLETKVRQITAPIALI